MSPHPLIVVLATDDRQSSAAEALAARLNLPLDYSNPRPPAARARSSAAQDTRWTLELADSGLSLRREDGARIAPDFTRGRGASHAREADLASQPLARALGIAALGARFERRVSLLDMTAGFGVDAWLAATLGAQVTMLERSAVVHALLEDALRRARDDAREHVRRIADRMALVHADAQRYAGSAPAPGRPATDIAYLDPMYPERRVRGGQRKGIEALQAIVDGGDDADDGQGAGLLDAALQLAGARVVVKRPRGAVPLSCATGRRPDDAIEGPKTRYDRYRIEPVNRESS